MAVLTFIGFVAIIACLSAWVILLLAKLGFVDWLAVHGNKIFSELAQCTFCLSWWTNVAFTALFAFSVGDVYAEILIIPFVATPITRKMLW